MPYLCLFYNDDIQQECVGINTCAIDMTNTSPNGKHELLVIAHNSDHGCRLILGYLEHITTIVKKRLICYRSRQRITTRFKQQNQTKYKR